VFLAVKNNSGADVNIYSSSGKAVSGSRQYDSKFSLADYPEVSSDIAPGAFTTGVVVFPAMNENAERQISAGAGASQGVVHVPENPGPAGLAPVLFVALIVDSVFRAVR
jgi:hypothetical protein